MVCCHWTCEDTGLVYLQYKLIGCLHTGHCLCFGFCLVCQLLEDIFKCSENILCATFNVTHMRTSIPRVLKTTESSFKSAGILPESFINWFPAVYESMSNFSLSQNKQYFHWNMFCPNECVQPILIPSYEFTHIGAPLVPFSGVSGGLQHLLGTRIQTQTHTHTHRLTPHLNATSQTHL